MGLPVVALPFSRFLLLVGLFKFGHAYKFSQKHENSSHEKATGVPLYQELASALPLVLQNLSNYSGLINDGGKTNSNITYHFGELDKDLALLSDKISGFYSVLHDMLPDGTGPLLCPLDKQSHIKECLLIGTCLLEEHVPEDIELATFTTYMEMTQRFLDINWPAIKKGLMFEEPTPVLNKDATAPKDYQCDTLKHKEVTPSLLQVHESDGATLAMSSAMVQAAKSSFQILEQHRVGSSVDATILKLHELWMPICKQLDCDHSSFWDSHYASYRQTASLLQLKSGQAARRAVRTEIQHRVKLEMRVVHFVSENYEYYSKIYNGTHHLPPGRRFIDPSFIQASSRAARKQLADQGRQSMLGHIIPFMKAIATEDEKRAIRLFDHVEFRKFQQRKRQRKHQHTSLLQEEQEDEEEETVQKDEDEESLAGFSEEDDEDDEHDGALAVQKDEDEETLTDFSEEDDEDDKNDSALAMLDTGLDSTEEDSEEDSVEGGRRRRRRRRRWIGGRRRSRRRRRIFDAIANVVATWPITTCPFFLVIVWAYVGQPFTVSFDAGPPVLDTFKKCQDLANSIALNHFYRRAARRKIKS